MMSEFAKEVLNNTIRGITRNNAWKKLGIIGDDNALCNSTYLIMIFNAATRMEIFNSEQRNNINGLYHRLMYK